MNTISVNASQRYDVLVGKGILSNLGTYAVNICGKCKAVMISDTNVFPIYGNIVESSLLQAGIETVHYVFSAGEESKTINTYTDILNFLAETQITRTDMVIALGGGVVGDIAGFAAATFLRGISYIQVPTSLLAMVDSSVGGKTAIDLPVGKNLVGAFKQPRLVLCDVNVLSTLPESYFIDGCAEIIKYCMLYDANLFAYLVNSGLNFDREMVISKCITFKAAVVHEDEFDTGARQKLNLGHTIGHGIELRSNFKISHGCAVAVGMMIVTKAAVKHGLCAETVFRSLQDILLKFSLPCATAFTARELYQSALSDKKRSGGSVNLIIPKEIGNCEIVPTQVSELESFIEAGL